jgi:hypothetical protein
MTPARHSLAHAALLVMLAACSNDPATSMSDHCQLSVPPCDCIEPGLAPIADLASTRANWLDGERTGLFAVEGTCSNGAHVLYRATGLSHEFRFFRPEGAFAELFLATDAGHCASATTSECSEAVVTRVLWGEMLSEGDDIRIPAQEQRGQRE